jgi:hypothetical protein
VSDPKLLGHPTVLIQHHHTNRIDYTPGKARLDPALRDKGLGKYQPKVELWEKGDDAVGVIPMVIAWPYGQPGLVVLDLLEIAEGLKVDDDAWTPSGTEKGDYDSPIARVRLAVEPGTTEVLFDPLVEALYDGDKYGRFEGVVFDVDLTVKDEKGKDRARFFIRGIPMVELVAPKHDDIVTNAGAEGSEWELEARLHYRPHPYKTPGKTVLAQGKDLEFTGDGNWHTYVPLKGRNRNVQFGMSRDPGKPAFTLMDRFVVGVHILTGWHGKVRRDRCLVTFNLQLNGKLALWAEAKLKITPTTSKSKGLLPKELTWKTDEKTFYVQDVSVELPARKATIDVEEAGRMVAWRSTYFLVPEKLIDKRKFSLKELLDEPRQRLSGPAPLPTAPYVDHVEFSSKGWEKYSFVLKIIVQKFALIVAWQKKYNELQEKWKDELTCYERVVTPVVRALEGIKFKTRNVNWAGRSDAKLSKLHVEKAHRATWEKVKLLRRIDDQIARHAGEALTLFSEDPFWEVFFGRKKGGDPFLGMKLQFAWSQTRDRLRAKEDKRSRDELDPLDRARGGDGSNDPLVLTIPAQAFTYDDALKVEIFTLIISYLPILARIPSSSEPEDPEGTVKAQKARIDLFRKRVEPGMADVFDALIGEKQQVQVDWLTDDADRAMLWKAGMFGAPSSLMYGGDMLKAKLAHVYEGPDLPSGRPNNIFLYTELDLERAGQVLKSRAAKYIVDAEFVFETSMATVKWIIDMYRFSTGDLGWNVSTILDAADLAVASTELMLRAGALSGRFGPDLVTRGGTHYFKVAAKIGPWIDVLKEGYNLYKQLSGMIRGKPTDKVEILFTVYNLIGLVCIAAGATFIGGIIVAFVIAARALYDAFRIIDMEQVPAWYARTPWGNLAVYDYDSHGGPLTVSDPRKMFWQGCIALSKFFSMIWKELKPEQKKAIEDYFGQWAEATGATLKVKVTIKKDVDFFKLVDF